MALNSNGSRGAGRPITLDWRSRRRLAGVRGELKAFRDEVAATDSENAKILETITHDLQARVVRDEKHIKALEKRPGA
jgi:hypothetical protein